MHTPIHIEDSINDDNDTVIEEHDIDFMVKDVGGKKENIVVSNLIFEGYPIDPPQEEDPCEIFIGDIPLKLSTHDAIKEVG